ncbi:DUF1758 domain-containing protein [Trichonephila clavata]|uniref:DUF1758 domain-containing protein n=1 Tax=Trichonephila clavata TaxID=2740835 RepID=A0A8X6JF66_TRICU|nr:DUF1758 domain-containing protein [Trichonephila clavata]
MLEYLEHKVDPTSDTILMHMILFKLDTNSRTWFERTFSTDVILKLYELLKFLATQARSITSLFTKRNVQRKVRDIWGNYQTCRCLLDSGNQASLITNECIERLGLRKEKANVRISCLGTSDLRTNGIAEIQFTSHFPSQNSFHASVYVINKIVGMIPHHDLDSSMRELFGNISLTDPAFYKSSPIVVLLGVDLTFPLLRGQTLSLGKDKPFVIRSELGWIIGEEACEDHFVKTRSRDENGRYTVRLPFHTPPTWLVNSKQNAIRRLFSMERHLISNPDKYKLYRNFMKEYLDLKHMELVPDSEINSSNSLYLLHHGVVRDTSCTTKLRVVFDSSSKTSSGLSLNDMLMVGPRVQPELFPILVQFRIFSVAICADVEKMFRQIKIYEQDVDWQRIL